MNKSESPLPPVHVAANPTYAREAVGTQRYSRTELARLRAGIRLAFAEPDEAARVSLIRAFEQIQGRSARPSQVGYLYRCARIHGPSTEQRLQALYRHRGSTTNLLLALELADPSGDGIGTPGPRR